MIMNNQQKAREGNLSLRTRYCDVSHPFVDTLRGGEEK